MKSNDEKVNDLIGIRYLKGGYTTKGADCWGLILLVLKNVFDLDLNLYQGAVFCGDELSSVIIDQIESDNEWSKVEKPNTGNVVVMYDKRNKRPEHIGIVVKHGSVLHSYKKAGSTQTPLRIIERMFSKVEFYRYERDCTNAA